MKRFIAFLRCINPVRLIKDIQPRPRIESVENLNQRSMHQGRRFDHLFPNGGNNPDHLRPEPVLPLLKGGTTREDLNKQRALIDGTKTFVTLSTLNLFASREDLRVAEGVDSLIKQGKERDEESATNRNKAREIINVYYQTDEPPAEPEA